MGLAESAWKYGRRALLRLSAERPLTGTEIHLASDAEVCLTAARGALTVLMAALDADLTNRAPGTLSVSDGSILMRQTVAAGLVVERAAIKIIELSMQVCGGAAYHSSHDLARNMRDVRALYYMRPYTPPNAWRDFLVASVLKEADYVL
jgi:alkylation response protein AidB-like acyl-CoA dehydrogenase